MWGWSRGGEGGKEWARQVQIARTFSSSLRRKQKGRKGARLSCLAAACHTSPDPGMPHEAPDL